MNQTNTHTFHIPVMGTGYTVDTPIKVAQYGISSVVSIVDDELLEKMRELHSSKFNISFSPISTNEDDFRAKRITAYLNLLNNIVNKQFKQLSSAPYLENSQLNKYIQLLPDSSSFKKDFLQLISKNDHVELEKLISQHLHLGSIDVNIMTKVDKENYKNGEKLPVEFNDAHAALRGFANSNLTSSLVLSAGLNPSLYSYLEHFPDFFPNTQGEIKKKIILKVSDYRSALIQGKFLAKKGIWVSEFRIESGLNCGGHAFATNGLLLGPILEEFKNNRTELKETMHQIMVEQLKNKNLPCPENPMSLKITVQGGVGTANEHQFLLDYYQMDSIGWGSPFLLVPEVCDVDENTRKLLADANEEDLYLSHSSPLGVRFNNIKGNSRDENNLENIFNGKPGSICTKKYMIANTEYTQKPVCTASREYQQLKIKHLKSLDLSEDCYNQEINKISEKSCLCKGLATASLLTNNLSTNPNGEGVSICPGPNMAYFSKIISLEEIINHIYGRINIIERTDRPNMFIKELRLYTAYLKEQLNDLNELPSKKQQKTLIQFKDTLLEGINYYKTLFIDKTILNDLNVEEAELKMLEIISIPEN